MLIATEVDVGKVDILVCIENGYCIVIYWIFIVPNYTERSPVSVVNISQLDINDHAIWQRRSSKSPFFIAARERNGYSVEL